MRVTENDCRARQGRTAPLLYYYCYWYSIRTERQTDRQRQIQPSSVASERADAELGGPTCLARLNSQARMATQGKLKLPCSTHHKK